MRIASKLLLRITGLNQEEITEPDDYKVVAAHLDHDSNNEVSGQSVGARIAQEHRSAAPEQKDLWEWTGVLLRFFFALFFRVFKMFSRSGHLCY